VQQRNGRLYLQNYTLIHSY